MKTRFLLVTLFALLAVIAAAQHPRHSIPTVKGPGEALQYGSTLVNAPKALEQAIKLTPAQASRLAAINAKYDAKTKAVYDAAKNHTPDMGKVRPIAEARWRDLYAVLTPSQQAALRKWVDTHHHHRSPYEPH